jgi:peptidoglycan hydrolase-like protein with peptidoglycan-binding domain
MYFEHGGMSVWWGMPDTPPGIGEDVRAGTEIPVTIGVRPADTSNRVEVLYRINNGPVETLNARWLLNDTLHKAQYFRTFLPAFRAGDTVEYTPVFRRAGRQVPLPEQVGESTSSFQIVEAGEGPAQGSNLSVGMYGEEVKLLHGNLRQLGFDIPTAEVDRELFGPATREAVQECQEQLGLPATGVVDERTRAAIKEAVAAKPASPAASTPSPPVAAELAPKRLNSSPEELKPAASTSSPPVALESAPSTVRFNIERLNFSPNELNSKAIGELQAALQKLKVNVQPRELARKELGPSTTDAIRAFQERAGLAPAGDLTAETVARLNGELEHAFVAGSKSRTQRLQEMLQRVGTPVEPDEAKSRIFGQSTELALKQYQAQAGLSQDGKVTEELVNRLREDALKARLSSKTQVAKVHRTLLRALNIAKLDVRVDANELKGKQMGPSTQAAIKAVQQKYGLPASGELDAATYDRLVSIAVSIPRPAKQLKVKTVDELKPIKRVARLNMNSQHVADVQRALAFLGYQIDEKEFTTRTFGKSTRAAAGSYQRARSLPVTGHVEGETLNMLNRELEEANPQAAVSEHPYRVRGSVRNELWEGMGGIRVQVWERLIDSQGDMLAERPSAGNGFFDIPYDPPREQATKQIKRPFHLQVKALDTNNEEIGSKLLFNPTLIAWVNFTQGDQPYRGTSEFESRSAAVSKTGNVGPIAALVETPQQRQISQAAQAAGLAADDVMRLVLAHRVADKLKYSPVGAEACYAYIGQNLPPSLPGDLIASTEDWTLIDQLVDLAANGLAFMDDDLQTLAFENAITENLIPIAVGRQKDTVLATLAQLKQTYTLEKPILIGNGSLKTLLDVSTVAPDDVEKDVRDLRYNAVAAAFLEHKSFGPAFWEDLNARPNDFGGTAAVQDLQTTVDVGHVTKNFVPMVKLLKDKINDPNVQDINSTRDLAKLTPERWVSLIQENGGNVPPSTDRRSAADRIKTYADTLASQSEQLFPAVALAATVGRSANNPLPHMAGIQQLLDTHPELDLRTTNLDIFVKEQDINLDAETLTEARVMQRVHRIAPTAAAGQALLDEKIHNSAQIMSLGKERFADTLTASDLVDRRTALTVYGLAEFQYAQVLQRIADYRFDLHRADPRAIIDYTYTADELPPALVGIPNLETLFGSLDFCDCPHCQSVYGPSAYLADVLRYLDSHSSEVANETVKDILFDRRPDIGNIKLNCENTETPLPYIDLVCEMLENAISAPNLNPDFSFQTTRTAAELRAFPEHVRQDAYDTLKSANYPLDVAFNLWQEEARVFLQHLGVSRWELMEAFQARPQGGSASPSDVSIAGEYWGMSTHETTVITTAENTADKQKDYWGFTSAAIPAEITVADFMRRSRLDYGQLLDLLYVRWINPPDDPNKMVIERPNATCNTEEQKLINLTAGRLDQMHRFLRLWRHTDWTMWELDLLIRTKVLGNSIIDSNTLVRLKQFKQLQQRLGLATDETLSLYGDINTEGRLKADEPQREIQPLYTIMFLNPAVVSPVDAKFVLPLAGSDHLSDHKATLLAAFALTETDLALLLAKVNNDDLTVANLSKVGRYVSLAKGLAMRVKDLLILEALSGTADIFVSPKATLDFIELTDWVTKSGFVVDELDYLLNDKPDSPYGLRDEAITQYVQALREAVRSNTASKPDGAIISQVASAFGLPPEQAQLVLNQVKLEGVTLLTHLDNPDLTARDGAGVYTTEITPTNFEDIYDTYRLLRKAALLLTRLQVTKADLEWLLKNFAAFNLLDPGAVPVRGAPAAPLFPAWLALYKWLYFKGVYPEPEGISLREVFDKAGAAATPIGDVKAAIAKLTPWKAQDLDDLATGLGLQHLDQQGNAILDYAHIDTYLRLWKCFKQITRIGAGAGMLLAWAKRDDANGAQATTAQQIRQAAKSKYDYSVWLDKVTPLEDTLREKKRDALVSYMVETSLRSADPEIVFNGKKYANPAYWRDANDLLNYFLIDVQMSACQLTSRIKQAMSSTQMFVQRCLLGLEQPRVEVSRAEQQDTASDNSWKQWKWMKNYRLWEANRKVFLYPENWIEPELRDDKSPFFEELEAEILQSDITDENVQAAFLRYVQKVHEVARLDIVGAYYELDDTDPRDNLPPDINVLHVVGRTRSHPAIYYYRRFDLNYGEWTAWEKIDVDIKSDQVTPVVYNRRLYLFWLNIIEKPQKVKKQPPVKATAPDKTTGKPEPTNTPETPNQLEIQLSWSARRDGGWTAKRVSAQKLIHPWQRPLYSYNLKPRYKSRENLLWLDIYISQSQQFNNTRFWDAYRDVPDFVTGQRWEETMQPWHSSSFLFDGEVVDVKMKGLAGQYHVLNSSGVSTDALTQTTSYTYVHDNFGAEGRSINPLSGPYEIAPRLPLPAGMHYHNTRLANNKRSLNANLANVLEHGNTRTLLNGAKSPFEIVFSQHQIAFDTADWGQVPFFYQDNYRAFFVKPEWQQVLVGYNQTLQTYNYDFYPFYHPYTALFMRELNRSGLDGLLNRQIQMVPESYYPGNNFNFNSYSPGSMTAPDETAEKDSVDFERYGAYSIYNWEIFFHAPLMIASKLSANQRFEEAMRWFHYIFDPTNVDSPNVPQRYWITRPFFEQNSDAYRQQRIEVLLENIEQHEDELKAWKNNPFKPHLIARYRPVAYQKTVVMKYIDNLTAWGDQLFRRDTIEAINEATTLYVLAYELLGRRPVKVPNVEHEDRSYNELTADGALDPFGNKRVDILMENFTGTPVRVTRTEKGADPLPRLDVFYFGIPNNDRLLDYWNTVEDRLFKIRHCMNIEGVVRQLPLFEPPIDPALLVKAAAAGVDLSSVLTESTAAPGPYRFQQLLQKAVELCGEVRTLGDKLLAALEKYDAEGLALVRSTQEIQLHQAVREVRKQQIQEANETWASLEKSKEIAQQKEAFYEGREFMNPWEITALSLGGVSALAETTIALGFVLTGGLALIPRINAGASGFGASPVVTADPIDGEKLAKASESAVNTLSAVSRAADKLGSLASTVGSYQRRQDDWTFQAQQATSEIAQIEKQIVAAQVRSAIAEKELENQELQLEQSQAVDEYMRSKYTNQQLYDWQVRQMASIYFQSYQLAYDMAKRAEKCFQFELGDPSATFVQFGYWDSLKKGLLAGERLANDIRRMETAYLDQNKRDLEITKHVSLAQFLPLSLLALKEAGACTILLPEWLFDMDYPGHYHRRLKSVSISIPSVVGPYTSVNCTLSLTNHGIRMTKDVTAGYGDPLAGGDTRFYKSPTPVTAIATSHGQNDAGMFELNFNDERFLPFEGAGAVSEWRIELPRENNQFDLATISDVILQVRYTATPSGDVNLISAAKNHVAAVLPSKGLRLLVLNHEFGTAWQRFLYPDEGVDQTLSFTLGREHLPFYARGKKNINLTKVDLIVESPEKGSFAVKLKIPGAAASDELMEPNEATYGGRQHLAKSSFASNAALLGDWQIQIKKSTDGDFKSLNREDVQNAYLVLGFKTS